ncbi:hypothetical protein GSI_05696 [Ganoderma sinense ZZ0214-1]|uniref:HAT C-terminal dimerisation domain-containing protein n=1 Tax=Ganoderma sinense ZZ0214-1 TaxID=1077348 RepID=A0A2G8SB89_9APHY|nr:hypothetical protein GSI_05696 [Ganoderma sinense ZZ0214-1]
MLQEYEGKLAFTTDVWMFLNHHLFIALCMHLEHKDELLSMVLNVMELAKLHMEVHLVSAFAEVLEEFGINEKEVHITCDNASNNDKMIKELVELLLGFDGERSHVRCFLHVLSLIVKALLHEFNSSKPTTRRSATRARGKPAEDDNADAEEDEEDDNNATDDLDPLREMTEKEQKQFEKDIRLVKLAIVKVFKDATLYFSHHDTPNLVHVIPVMDCIEETLMDASHGVKYSNAIAVACGLAKNILDKYYSLTDGSATYRIAMILHPRYKLSYFRKLKWTKGWQQTVHKLVKQEYANTYAGRFDGSQDKPESNADDSSRPNSPSQSSTYENNNSEGAWVDVDPSDDGRNLFNILDDFDADPDEDIRDKLEHYLTAPTQKVTDVIQWWKDRQGIYPNLSRMAIDYLTIPATSIDVERLFSHGQLILSHVRSRLSAQTMRAILCVGSWSVLNLVKPEEDLLA